MAKLPEEFISRLKATNDIVEVFRMYADLKKRGRIYVCCCPLHAEKTPSCTIYPDSASFYCFGCHEGGDVITLLMKVEHLSYMEAVKALADRCGMTVPASNPGEQRISVSRDKCYEINRETANFYYQNLLRGTRKEGLQFLAAQQIRPQTVKKFGLGFAPDEWHSLRDALKQKGFSEQELLFSGVCQKNHNSVYDTFRNRLIFPVIDLRGNVAGFSGLEIYQPSGRLASASPNQDRILFSLSMAEKSSMKNFILAEDPLNAVLLWQAGIQNVIATPGKFLTSGQIKLIKQYCSEIILISSDLQIISPQMLNVLSNADLSPRIIQIGDAHSSGELIQKIGAEAFRHLLDQAGDARRIALQKAADQDSNPGNVIQRIVQVLVEIHDPLEREIYLTNTARELGIAPEILQSHVGKLRHEKQPVNSGSRSLTSVELQQPVLNKQPYREKILIYLMRHPEAISEASHLSGKHFDLPEDAQLYRALCSGRDLEQEEQDRAVQLREIYQNLEISYQDFRNAINLLTG